MNRKAHLVLLVALMLALPLQSEAAFAPGHLFLVNEPSSVSAGYDFILELLPEGTNLRTLVPKSQQILGMTRLAYDQVSGHLFYSISRWDSRTFLIREIDDTGAVIKTYAHPDFGSGNISMIFDSSGHLHIANDGYIYRKRAGEMTIEKMSPLPYTGIGDLEIDSKGNLYLSDPFVNNAVYKILPDGTVTIFADGSSGIIGPYGMAMDENDNLYVANSSYPAGSIVKISPAGQVSVFADTGIYPGILNMTFDANQVLFASNRSMGTIQKFDGSGAVTPVADVSNGLDNPSCMAFIINKPICVTDWDGDRDVDGSDLFAFASSFQDRCLSSFAAKFGK